MKYAINLDKTAQKHLNKIRENKKLLKRALEIIDNISQNPYSPEFKFEKLKYNLAGFCSKRLDAKNRIIYRVVENEVVIIVVSFLGHYDS
jgi:toxin YoeB